MEKKGINSTTLFFIVCGFILFTGFVITQAPTFARVYGSFLAVSDENINLKIAIPINLGVGRQRLYDDQGVLRGYQAYDSRTGVGFTTLVYSPLPGYSQQSPIQALLAEENRMMPVLTSIYALKSDEIVRTVRTWNNNTARIGRYNATTLDTDVVFVNDFTRAVASMVYPNLAFNTYLTVASQRLGSNFQIRTMFELRYYNGTNNGTLGRGNNTADIVFTVAVLPSSQAGNEAAMFQWRDYTDSSAIAEYADVVLNDTVYDAVAKDPMIDFVLIVDNSYSMDDHQMATANAANVFRSQLARTGFNNFRVALLSSSFYNPSCWTLTNGKCDESRNASCRPFVSRNRLAALGSWLTPNSSTWIGAGNTPCQTGTEKALLSLQEITSSTNQHATYMPPSAGQADPQKFRKGAHVVFIFVGDADDQSYGTGMSDSKGTCRQGINNYYQYLVNLRNSNGFASMTLGGILCPYNVPCAETQCSPRIIRSVINRFNGFIGDINSASDVSAGMSEIMRDVMAAASSYKLRYRAISTSINVTLPRNGLTMGRCPLQVPRSMNNGFDFDAQRNSIVFYGNCRFVNVTASRNDTIKITYSYWSRNVNCSQYRDALSCNPTQCRWCGTSNGTAQQPNRGVCVSNALSCPAIIAAVPGVYGGYGQGANGGYTAAKAAGIPWWAILLLILFLCCLCLLCLLLLLLLFLLFKPGPKKGSSKKGAYSQVDNAPQSGGGSYTPPADDYTSSGYASGSGTAGSGYAADDSTGGYAAEDSTGGYDPSGGAVGSGSSGGGGSGLKPHGGRPMTLDAGVSPNDQGDPNVRPDDNKYILFGGQPKWPG